MKVLVAEDDAVSRLLLKGTLERAGYEVVSVENGRQALDQLCGEDAPRLALLDWMMPELDGPTVCREVRKQIGQAYRHIILVTSRESKQDVVEGLESGADDYLIKPYDPEELKARLRSGQRILDLEDKLVEAREDMRFRATRDALTGIYNRGMILDFLGREVSRTQREHGNIAVLLCDLDHFKKVNDTYGHLVGDEVLREVAKRLVSSVRSYDIVGRYGGEEFLIILNNCPTKNALMRADEMRKEVSLRPMVTEAGPLTITMSTGVATSDEWQGHPFEDYLREADKALYQAKAEGRNRVKYAQLALAPAMPRI